MSDATLADRVQCLLEAAYAAAQAGHEQCSLAVANCGDVTANVRALEAQMERMKEALQATAYESWGASHTQPTPLIPMLRCRLCKAIAPDFGAKVTHGASCLLSPAAEKEQEPPACRHRSTASVGSDAIHEEFECPDCHRSWVTVLKVPPPPTAALDRLRAEVARLKKLEAAQGLGADFTSLATDLATNCERSVWAQANKVQGWVNGVREELSEFEKATTSEHKAEELGDVLWNLLSAIIMFCNETAPAHSLKSILIKARTKLRQRKPWIFDGTPEGQLPKTPKEETERYANRKAELKAPEPGHGGTHPAWLPCRECKDPTSNRDTDGNPWCDDCRTAAFSNLNDMATQISAEREEAESALDELVSTVATHLDDGAGVHHLYAGPREPRKLTPAAAIDVVKRWAENTKIKQENVENVAIEMVGAYQALLKENDEAKTAIEVLKKSLDLARLTWTQYDTHLPIIDDAISTAFPTISGRHDLYALATTLVGAKHMKYSIVDAFQWCFVTIDRMGKALDKIYNSTDAARDEVVKHYGVLHTHKPFFDELERLSHEVRPHGHLQPRNGIYVASKVRHASKWNELRKLGTPIFASWLDESEPGQTASYPKLWTRIIQEAFLAEAMVFYVEPGETMKGSLVELGAALAAGVPVYAVGIPEGATFSEHPLVTKCETVEEAFRLATKVISNPEAVLTQLRIKANEELDRARFEVRFCSTSYRDGEMLYDTYMDRKKAAYDKVQLAHDKVDQQLRKMGRIT